MSRIVFTQAAIAAVLGDEYIVKESRNNNFQVNVIDPDAKVKPSPLEQYKLILRGVDKLRKAGYDVREEDVKAQYRDRKSGEWRTWPHIWVNQNRPGSHAGTTPAADVLQQLIERGVLKKEDLVSGLVKEETPEEASSEEVPEDEIPTDEHDVEDAPW